MKSNSHRLVLTAAFVAVASVATPALAQLSVGGTASVGQLGYEIESNTQQNWRGTAKLLTLGADVSLPGGFYGALTHSTTSGGEVDFRFQGNLGATSTFKRNDSALTVGWSMANRLNTFVGLRTGFTDIDNSIDTRFKTSGYFVGLSYPVALGPAYLSFSLAIGGNKGTWSDTSGPPYSDTAFGYSGGVKVAYSFTPQIAASAGLKLQRYNYDFSQVGVRTLDEKVRALECGLNFNF